MSVGPLASLHCPRLFDEIIKLRPEWAGTKLTKDGEDAGWNHEDGAIRIVMTGTAERTSNIELPTLNIEVKSAGQVADGIRRAVVAGFEADPGLASISASTRARGGSDCEFPCPGQGNWS